MRGLLLLLALGVAASAWSATVYKWVDENGVVHYSDQPNPKAEKLNVSGAQTYSAQDAARAPPPAVASGPAAPAAVCAIDRPAPGQVFQDTFSITGHVTLAHTGEDSQAMLRFDGQDISGLLSSDGNFELSQVDRGDHSLTLQVTDSRGAVTCQASAVTFTIRQRSEIAPTVPTVPAAPRAAGANGQAH